MHRDILDHENLNEIFSLQEKRSLSIHLTMQCNKVLYMIEDTLDNRQLAKNKVTVFDYYTFKQNASRPINQRNAS